MPTANKLTEGTPVSGDVSVPEAPTGYDQRSVYEVDPTLAYDADPDFQRFYKQILEGMSPETIDYKAPTAEEIAAQISEYLRPAVDQQIRNRQLATGRQRAQTDADAASRGILASTWVTDIKNRLMQNESADIAAAESDYRSQLLQGVYNRQAQEADRALQIAMFNAQMKQDAEKEAYSRAGDMYNLWLKTRRGGGGGGGGGNGGSSGSGDNGAGGSDKESAYLAYLRELARRHSAGGNNLQKNNRENLLM